MKTNQRNQTSHWLVRWSSANEQPHGYSDKVRVQLTAFEPNKRATLKFRESLDSKLWQTRFDQRESSVRRVNSWLLNYFCHFSEVTADKQSVARRALWKLDDSEKFSVWKATLKPTLAFEFKSLLKSALPKLNQSPGDQQSWSGWLWWIMIQKHKNSI